MRFDFDAYEKVFPVTPEAPVVDSAVDTFKPTESEKATDGKPGDEQMKATPKQDEVPTNDQIVTTEEVPGDIPKGVNNE